MIVQPALGPSLGVAPAGTCTCSAASAKKRLPGSRAARKCRANVCAIFALSFITSPSWPGARNGPLMGLHNSRRAAPPPRISRWHSAPAVSFDEFLLSTSLHVKGVRMPQSTTLMCQGAMLAHHSLRMLF